MIASIGKTAGYNALQVEVNKRIQQTAWPIKSLTPTRNRLTKVRPVGSRVEGQISHRSVQRQGKVGGPSGFDLRQHAIREHAVSDTSRHGQRLFERKMVSVDYIVGNWQINNNLHPRDPASPSTFFLRWPATLANTGNVSWAQYDRANLVGDPTKGSCPDGSRVGSVSCVFNTSAFAVARAIYFSETVDATHSAHPSSWNLDNFDLPANSRSGRRPAHIEYPRPRPSNIFKYRYSRNGRATTFRICQALDKSKQHG